MSDSDELGTRLDAMEARLLRIEARLGMLPRTPPPPPADAHIAERPAFHVPAPGSGPPPVVGSPGLPPAARTVPTAAEAADAEYQLGGKLLPWAGALVTILAIGYGVNLAFQHGIITPWMIFWGGVVLCSAFIGVGQAKRDEREEFGQLLTGIGSCGLYLTFAAGHLAQHLYEGEVLVGLFTALSLVNLAYSGWRASHAFFYIGVLGGFAGALMPLDEGRMVLHLGLHALILVPSALIVIRQNWFREACVLVFLGLGALVPALALEPSRGWTVLSLEGTALLAAYAYARTHIKSAWDPEDALAPALLLGAGVLAYSVQPGWKGTGHIVAYGLLILAVGRSLGERSVAQRFLLAGAMVPLLVGPWGAPEWSRPYVFAVLAVLLAAVTRDKWDRGASALSGAVFVLGLFSLLAVPATSMAKWSVEASLLGALLIGGTASAAALIRAWKQPEAISGVGALVLSPLLIRIVTLGMAPAQVLHEGTTFLWGLALATAVVAGLSMVTRWRAPGILAAVAAGTMLLGYALAMEASAGPWGWDLGLVTLMTVSVLACTVAGWRAGEGGRPSIAAVAGVALGFLMWRFLAVSMVGGLGASTAFAGGLAGALSAAAIAAVGRWKGWTSLVAPTWMLWALGVLMATGGYPVGRTLLEGVLMGSLVAGGWWAAYVFDGQLKGGERTLARFGGALAIGYPFSKGCVLALTLPAVGMPSWPAITAAWTLYAAILLSVGFLWRMREVRYVGLVAIGGAAVKLVLMDLANSRDLVRFLVTLGLGIAMIGGGYLYIRLQSRLGSE